MRTRAAGQASSKAILAGAASALVLVALALPGTAGAAPGDLDEGFGGTGKVVVNFNIAPWGGGYADDAFAVAAQPDGRLVVGGASFVVPSRFDFALARLLPDGSLDPTFGGGDGKVTTDIGPGKENVLTDLVIQPDGNIVAVGHEGVIVARYTQAGELDPSFGSGGVVTTDLLGSYAWGVALQTDGKIIVVGQTWQGAFGNVAFVARYLSSGALDPTFGVGGIATSRGIGTPRDVVVQSDGKIVVGGGGIGQFLAARYTDDGQLDASFGHGGVARFEAGSFYAVEGRTMTLQPDGSIVVAGRITAACCSGGTFGAVRFTAQGQVDSTFGTGGVATVGFDGLAAFGDGANSVAVQPNAKIVLAGHSMQPGARTDLAIARLTADGRLDETFGGDGRVLTTFDYWPGIPGNSESIDVALQQDGGIVAVGLTFTGLGAQDFAVARYFGDANDQTPPTLDLPGSVVADATSPAGAALAYDAAARDDMDPAPIVVCEPGSRSLFPIGRTTVTCTATDAARNSSSASFDVHVKGAPEQLADFRVAAIGIGPGSSLADKIRGAQAALGGGGSADACDILDALSRQVAAQRGKSIAEQHAAELLATAARIGAVLSC